MATRAKDDGHVRRTRVFMSGNSRAVRLPAGWGLEPGQEVELRQEGGAVTVAPVPKKIDLTGIYGSMPWLEPLTPEEREIDERELDWDGKLLKRG